LKDVMVILKSALSVIGVDWLDMGMECAHWVDGCMMRGRHDLQASVSKSTGREHEILLILVLNEL